MIFKVCICVFPGIFNLELKIVETEQSISSVDSRHFLPSSSIAFPPLPFLPSIISSHVHPAETRAPQQLQDTPPAASLPQSTAPNPRALGTLWL